MRSTLLLTFALAAYAQAQQFQVSHTTESLRGVSVVSRQIAWASGTHGTYLRTSDGGRTWTPAQVSDATALDFRAVVAFSADEAFLMSAGPGDQSRIYHTTDAGRHWRLQFTNDNPKGFFDSMAFWDPKHGIVLGDPIPDDTGKLKFELLQTDDGETWKPIPAAQLPEALPGEGAFAASNSCLAILGEAWISSTWKSSTAWKIGASAPRLSPIEQRASAPEVGDRNIWFATGGKAARVFHSPDRGQTWHAYDTPIQHGPDSAGIFSIAFRDPLHGVIAGGDYKLPNADGPNLAFTDDGGKTWTLSQIRPQAYFSAVTYDLKVRTPMPERLFVVAQDAIFDLRPPKDPVRISVSNKKGVSLNAASPYPEGGALIVGAKGAIASIP